MVQLYLIGGSIVTLGFLWFWIVRPIVVALRDAYDTWCEERAARPGWDDDDLIELPARGTRPPLPVDVMFRPVRSARMKSVQGAVAATPETALPVIAMPGNAGNDALPGNAVARPTPDDARDIIRMQAKAEAVVALLASKRMTNKAEAIELIFGCKRSGRPGSMYQQALALVDALTDRYPHRTPEQESNRAELKLGRVA